MTGDAEIREGQARKDPSRPPSEGNVAAGLALGGFPQAAGRLIRLPQPRRTVKSYFALLQFGGWIWIRSFSFFPPNLMLLLAGGWLRFFLGCDSLLRCVLGWEQEGPIIAGLCR